MSMVKSVKGEYPLNKRIFTRLLLERVTIAYFLILQDIKTFKGKRLYPMEF